ncbi:condensation domain-containing protein [Pelistega sp. MC2]|uniref:condensation domain-containing protein n=1 Tax=Pelistega sp. MC2 TaxID=1720297 RepID=UPI0008D8DE24|nr:condensation domain-containing protein [Pelistega sp. MC2]
MRKKEGVRQLTSLQMSYLLGRKSVLPLSGVSMQEYREYYGRIDNSRLLSRIKDMIGYHECLRTYIDEENYEQYVVDEPVLNVDEIDLRENLGNEECFIQDFREKYSHEVLDLGKPLWNITLIQRSNGYTTIFIKFDALIVDGRSISILIKELFEDNFCIKDVHESEQKKIKNIEHIRRDKAYWVNKFSDLRYNPIKWNVPITEIKESRFKRKSLLINNSIEEINRFCSRNGLFVNSFLIAVIMEVLATWKNTESICCALPVLPLYKTKLSNNSSFIVVNWEKETRGITLESIKELQVEIMDRMEHLHFSGVELGRYLAHKNNIQAPLPIVITSGLSWISLSKDCGVSQISGLTQTPQIIMDVRFQAKEPEGCLNFDVDFVEQAIFDEDVVCLLNLIQEQLNTVITAS